MSAAEDVLTSMQFVIEKSDLVSGLIRTKPLRGSQFFELWRSDNVSAKSTAEANLHSIQRTVQLTISEQGNRVCVKCDVEVQRLSSGMQRLALNEKQQEEMSWIDLGGDPGLERKILQRLKNKIAAL